MADYQRQSQQAALATKRGHAGGQHVTQEEFLSKYAKVVSEDTA